MGEIADIDKKAFFALSLIRNRQFQAKGWRQCDAHSVFVYVLGMYSSYLYINIQRGNIVSSFIFARRLAMPESDEQQDKSHALFVYMYVC